MEMLTVSVKPSCVAEPELLRLGRSDGADECETGDKQIK